MNLKKRRAIIEKYWFFPKPSKPITDSLMAFGIDCGDGWLDLIDDLCSKIERYIDNHAPELQTYPFPFEVFQIKEKFGELRFYTSTGDDEIYKLIDDAVKKSCVTCELCGKAGKLRDTLWLATLCDKHHREREKKNAGKR